MHEPERIVVFVGAGFSVAAGVPVMTNYLDVLRDNHLTPKEVRYLDAIVRDCSSRASLIQGNVRNLEVLASFLSMIHLATPGHRFRTSKNEELAASEAIALFTEFVGRVAGNSCDSQHLQNQSSLIGLLATDEAREATFITTNYDTVLELLGTWTFPNRPRGGLRLPDDGSVVVHSAPISRITGETAMISQEAGFQHPLLLKLHGSVNWVESDGITHINANVRPKPLFQGDRPIDDSDGVGVTHPTSRKSADRYLEWAGATGGVEGPPKLILPTVLKPEMTPYLRKHWELASDALIRADQIWFVGYSFPDTDNYMKFFLATCLAENARIRHIAVIDPSRPVFYERAQSVFADPRLQAVMKYYPYKAERVNWEKIYRQQEFHLLDNQNAVVEAELEQRRRMVQAGDYYSPQPFDLPVRPSGRGRGRGRSR